MNIEDTKALEDALNKEYAKLGTIKIDKAYKATVNVSEIRYVEEVLNGIEPLQSEQPIVVAKRWGCYELIDGYHRLKYWLPNAENIGVVVLESYAIKRHPNDDLLSFMQRLTGDTLCFLDNDFFTVNGEKYYIKCNEGCGGCDSGWSDFELNKDFKGKKMKVKNVAEIKDEGMREDEYGLCINGKVVAKVDTGWGNGYYGGDFNIIKV